MKTNVRKNFASQSGFFTPRILLAFVLCSVGVLLAMFSFAGTSPNAMTTATADWSVVPSPNAQATQTTNILQDVTCESASDCWAVGYHDAAFGSTSNQTLIERWDGTSWAIVSSPSTSATQNNLLFGVTCVSASDCWAVGQAYAGTAEQTLIERWDGNSWSIVGSPNTSSTQRNFLRNVICTSSSDCWAVGFYLSAGGYQTLIERWDGISWSIVPSPNTIATQSNVLFGVTCVSTSNCVAVGYYSNGGTEQTLIERWDGNSWTIVTSPNTSTLQKNRLFSVTCTSASDCWAVGDYNDGITYQTLTERWDGTSWVGVASPNTSIAQDNFLHSVTCQSATDCWSSGYYKNGNNYQTLIERWNGTSWTIITSPNSSAIQDNLVFGVTCVSGSNCWAAGYYNGDVAEQTLTERWDGISWTVVSSPNTKATQDNILQAVTCASDSECWAVGSYLAGTTYPYQTLIERWNGISWSIVTSPNPGQYNSLVGVTCTSASDCWAVGSYSSATGATQTLIERWDGSSWSIVPSSNTSVTQTNVLQSVTCASATDCWAVGYSLTGNFYHTLIERWDGTSWSLVISPDATGAAYNVLQSVTCASATDCWAVGFYLAGSVYQTLIERWNGTSWTIVPSANTSADQSNFLRGVTCVSASDCWTVGQYVTDNLVNQTLTERWNGTSWSIVPSPDSNATQHNFLFGVTCTSTSDCWAAGYYYGAGIANQTLIQQWNGASWTIVNSPNTSTSQQNLLYGITCAKPSDCWTVGYSVATNGVDQTLIEHYTVPPVPLNGVVSRKTHGSAGTFDIDLPLTGSSGAECRTDGANGDYTMVFTFANPLSSVAAASVTSGSGSVSSSAIDGSDAHRYIVNLTGVTNTQTITVSLTNVNDSAGNSSATVSASMAILIGDTNADRSVNSADISQTKSQSGQPVTASNFREDVTVDGSLNSADISLVKSKSGTVLPQ